MKVAVFVKKGVKDNPTVGKISEILPASWEQYKYGKQTLENFIPIIMELKIPCNDDKSDLFPCGKCKYNDWELCDRIKYLRNNWTTGDIFTEPKPTDYRYKINFESFISKDSVDLFKVGMSETTKDTIIANAINNERTEIDIIENTKLIVESK